MRIKFSKDEKREFLKAVENFDYEAIRRIIKLDEAVNDKRWRKEFEGYLNCIAEYDEADLLEDSETGFGPADKARLDYNSTKTMEALGNFIVSVTTGGEWLKEHKRKERAAANGFANETPADGNGLW